MKKWFMWLICFATFSGHGAIQQELQCDGVLITSEFERMVGNGPNQYARCTFHLLISQEQMLAQLKANDLAGNLHEGQLEIRNVDQCGKLPWEVAFELRRTSYDVSYYDRNIYRPQVNGNGIYLHASRMINNSKLQELEIKLDNCE